MSGPVKARRTYDSPRRQERALATRAAMLDAARDLFVQHRFAGTTLAMVAEASGVSVQNVYKVFGNKAGLAKAVFDASIAGDTDPTAVQDRPPIMAIRAEPDPRRKLEMYGRHMATVGPRIMPILTVVRDAAASDDSAAHLWQDLQSERLTGMTRFAQDLHTSGQLRSGVGLNEARDVLWTYNSLEIWDLLVTQRNWTPRRYGTWIASQLAAALL